MNRDHQQPVRLEPPHLRGRVWTYVLAGALLGGLFEVLVCEPLDIFLQNIFDFFYRGSALDPARWIASLTSRRIRTWPGVTSTGFLYGAVLGYIFFRLKEQRQRLRTLHREFELQVATLRHHYKNLAIGIGGFAIRIKRKLGDLPECEALEKDVAFLDDASRRLSHTLGEELKFLKALTSDAFNPIPGDIYPSLKHAVEDLMGLRFKEKDLRVEIDGQPLEATQEPLVFPFEPYAMEVILQNILSNAMKFGDFIQVGVASEGGWVKVEVKDNGPGLEVDRLKQDLLTPRERKPESTHLGIEVTLHLLEKCGGRLSGWSEPGAGTIFTLEFPKQPPRQ